MTKIVIGPFTSAKELRNALASSKHLDDQWSLSHQLSKIEGFFTACDELGVGVSITIELDIT